MKQIDLAVSNNRLKDINNWLGKTMNELENELINKKSNLKNLELIYRKSNCVCEKQLISKTCENCTIWKTTLNILLKFLQSLLWERQIWKQF